MKSLFMKRIFRIKNDKDDNKKLFFKLNYFLNFSNKDDKYKLRMESIYKLYSHQCQKLLQLFMLREGFLWIRFSYSNTNNTTNVKKLVNKIMLSFKLFTSQCIRYFFDSLPQFTTEGLAICNNTNLNQYNLLAVLYVAQFYF